MNARANRYRSGYQIRISFSSKPGRINFVATLVNDNEEEVFSASSDVMDEAATQCWYALEERVDAYEAERDAEELEPYSDDRQNGVSESQFLYRP